MSKFSRYLAGTIIKPGRTFHRLLDEPDRLSLGVKAILLIGVLYTLTVMGLAAAEAQISACPWIAIPGDKYYFWEIFFAMPVTILDWILAAGTVQLLSKFFKGSGTFEDTLAVLGFAITIPFFVTWIPETLATFLMLTGTVTQQELFEITTQPGLWSIFSIGYQLAAAGWIFILVPVAVSAVQKLRWWQAAIVGIPTAVIFMFVMLIFIR